VVSRRIPIASLVLSVLVGAGCGPDRTIEDRFVACRDMLKDREALQDPENARLAFDCFTPGTRSVAMNLQAQKGEVVYALRLDKLLDYEEPTGAPDIENRTAILTVKKGRSVERLFLELDPVDNVWRFDLFELPRFWQPLNDLGAS
jgi:hypothetical protein